MLVWRKILAHGMKRLATPDLKDADQWQSNHPVWRRFVCTICAVEIGMDGSVFSIELHLLFDLLFKYLLYSVFNLSGI